MENFNSVAVAPPKALPFLASANMLILGAAALLAIYWAATQNPFFALLAGFAGFAAYAWHALRKGRYWAWLAMQILFMLATLGLAFAIIQVARSEAESKTAAYAFNGIQIIYLATCWIYLHTDRVRAFCSVPARSEDVPEAAKLRRWMNVFGYITAVLMFVNLYNIFVYVPTESSMGLVQRIFYFHVPSAFMAFAAFALTFVYSIRYLSGNRLWHDRVAYCSAEIGVIFTSMVLTTGPIWAKPIWNTWWTWDPRLTTTLVLWFIYIGYLMLRSFTGEEQRGARFAAVFAVVGFVDVPIVYMANRLWRTLHPQPVIFGGSNSGLATEMRYVLAFSVLTFLSLFIFLLLLRLRLERVRLEIDHVKRETAFSQS